MNWWREARTIWVMTHMDIVPPGVLPLWRGTPYKAWVEHGKIYTLVSENGCGAGRRRARGTDDKQRGEGKA